MIGVHVAGLSKAATSSDQIVLSLSADKPPAPRFPQAGLWLGPPAPEKQTTLFRARMQPTSPINTGVRWPGLLPEATRE